MIFLPTGQFPLFSWSLLR